jgi:hypothetical protein
MLELSGTVTRIIGDSFSIRGRQVHNSDRMPSLSGLQPIPLFWLPYCAPWVGHLLTEVAGRHNFSLECCLRNTRALSLLCTSCSQILWNLQVGAREAGRSQEKSSTKGWESSVAPNFLFWLFSSQKCPGGLSRLNSFPSLLLQTHWPQPEEWPCLFRPCRSSTTLCCWCLPGPFGGLDSKGIRREGKRHRV